ncbi:hypothetical protein HMI54_012712 [Coelomomyces lativittatus]|nr:hypothetical protein HMI56_005195 [Coelomomyces lativittatus]KAJ1498389.1 hypothetical protein HMI54_012712 [Coelomomyces lativittatus]KAJ1498414.1 hypothetical protein HMI55_004937 [Coelomomyces lativittatus]
MYLPLVTLVPKGLLSSSNVQPKERNEEGIEEYQATLKKLQQTPIGPMKQTEIPFPSIEGILAYKDRNFERELRERFDIGEHDVQSLVGGLPSIEDGEEEDSETNGDETILELPEGNNSDSKDPTSPLEGHKLYKAIMEDLQLETESKKLKH